MNILDRFPLALVPLAVLVLLVTTNVQLATNSITLYETLFDRYNVAGSTGILDLELSDVGRQFQDYFANDAELLEVRARVNGVEQQLLTEREVLHMADVKDVFNLTFLIQKGAGIYLLLMALGAIVVFRRQALWEISGWVQWGALATILFVLVVGLVSLVAFGPLFNVFHQLVFTNDLWQLDPRTSYLLKLFPFGFWRDITLLIGLATLLEGLVLFILGRRLTRLGSRSRETAAATN